MCKNKEGANVTFNSHPQFINDAEYRPKMNVLSSSFRLSLKFDTHNGKCSWRFSRQSSGNKTDENEIQIKNTNEKYVVEDNTLAILKPNSEDSGVYFCELKNEYGHNFRAVDITVKS
jgi:hypothetical protein